MQFKQFLSIGTLSLCSIFSLARPTQKEGIIEYDTLEHCKFINNDSAIVINYQDTLSVIKIYKVIFYENNQKRMTCKVKQKNDDTIYELVFNPEYYKTTPWLPFIQYEDTVALDMVNADKKLTKMYYIYDNMKQYKLRDSIEQKLIANRQKLIKHSREHLSR